MVRFPNGSRTHMSLSAEAMLKVSLHETLFRNLCSTAGLGLNEGQKSKKVILREFTKFKHLLLFDVYM